MRTFLFLLSFLFVVISNTSGQSIARKDDTSMTGFDFSSFTPTELPRPNSNLSYEQAEKRKGEIYNLRLTPKYFDWDNPTSGQAVHINKKDEIEIYNYAGLAKYKFFILKDMDRLGFVQGGHFGNPACVLITSEIPLDQSASIKEIMDKLWKPGVQLFYLTKMQ